MSLRAEGSAQDAGHSANAMRWAKPGIRTAVCRAGMPTRPCDDRLPEPRRLAAVEILNDSRW